MCEESSGEAKWKQWRVRLIIGLSVKVSECSLAEKGGGATKENDQFFCVVLWVYSVGSKRI